MYIRKSLRSSKGKTYTNYLLVKSVATKKGPRQRVICSMGDLSPRTEGEWLKLAHKVESSLVGQVPLAQQDAEVAAIVAKVRAREARAMQRTGSPAEGSDLVEVHTDGVRQEEAREGGSLHVGYQFWKRLEMDRILEEVGLAERERALACGMVMNRLIHPCSEHAMPGWMNRTALGDVLGLDLRALSHHALYRQMDGLWPNREKIELRLASREARLFNLDRTIVFYDVTSTYFEGEAKGIRKAKRGYSRDGRPDAKQVLVGMGINGDGFPVAHEIFEGNLLDTQTLTRMLEAMDHRIGLKAGQTVVVDRGMAFEENLEQIRARGLHYVVAARQAERDRYLDAFEDGEGLEEVIRVPSPTNPYQKKSRVRVKQVEAGGECHILCISEERVEKDRAIREKQEKRLLADVEKLTRRVREGTLVREIKIGEAIGRLKEWYPRVARYYDFSYDAATKTVTCAVLREKRAAAGNLDGSYLLKTDRKDLTAEEAWRIYMMLTRAENAFRTMKSPLAERPIFHQIDRRVETHIFLCVLAYHLLVAIEKTLLDQGVHTSWATVRESLKTHQVITIVLPASNGKILKIRRCTVPEPLHKKLYDLLDVPHRIISPRKWWETRDQALSDSD
jgi:transposase